MFAAAVGTLYTHLTSENTANRDFISYWAAGRLLLHGANPYDSSAVFALEKSVGFHQSDPLVMRNPPYVLPFTFPLGMFPPRVALVLWLLLLIGCIAASVRMIRDLYSHPANRLHLIGYFFAPVLEALFAAQTSIFALLGLTLFLRFHRRKPFLAGAALLLCAFKPHLFLPFGVALLLWVLARRNYRILGGALSALGVSLFLVFCLDSAAWSQYRHLAKSAGVERMPIPSASVIFRVVVAPHEFWVQFVPAALAIIWAIAYFLRNRKAWDWTKHGSLLTLISVWVAPYSWFTDEVVLVPAILGGLYWRKARKRTLTPFFLIAGFALFEVYCRVPMAVGYFWTTTAWFVWYITSVRPNRKRTLETQPQMAVA